MRNYSFQSPEVLIPYQPLTKFLSGSIAACILTLIIAAYPLGRSRIFSSLATAFTGQTESRSGTATLKGHVELSAATIERQVQYVLAIIQKSKKDEKEARKLAESIVKASARASYDPLFVASVIRSESTFNNRAISSVGATGLMQILPDTGRYISGRSKIIWNGETSLTNPEYNLALGIAYLKDLEAKFKGNREHALIAYNWGPGNLYKAFKGTKTIPTSSMDYAKSIISRHSKWQKDFVARADHIVEGGAYLG